MNKDKKPADKSIKPNNHPDFLIGLFTSLSSAGFFLTIIAVSVFTGSIRFDMSNAVWFMLFIFIASVTFGILIYMSYARAKNNEIKQISDSLEKIMKGQYDIPPIEVSDKYAEIAKNLVSLADNLKKAEAANNDFMNDFSHEIKTPIVSIRGFARLLLKGNLTKDEEKEYLKIIVSESERLIDLTAGTLLLDRLSNNRLEVEEKLYNLSEQLRRCILMLQSDWESKNIDISADFLEYFIVGNEELISQLLLNVIQNAIKFTNENGKVSVSVSETDKYTTVTVSDNGIGMDAETKRRMFDKYFRGDKSRSTSGNGLGLATVKRIAEVCNIALKVDSKENVGTNFYITFKK